MTRYVSRRTNVIARIGTSTYVYSTFSTRSGFIFEMKDLYQILIRPSTHMHLCCVSEVRKVGYVTVCVYVCAYACVRTYSYVYRQHRW